MQSTIHRFLALLAAAGSCFVLTQATSFAQSVPASSVSYANLPLSFEQNTGQFDSSLRFVARGASYSLGLGDGQMSLWLQGAGNDPGDIIVTHLLGTRRVEAVPEDELPGKVNYLRGREPGAWKTNIDTYRRVRYRNVYPGTDLVYYGNQGRLEYDFVLTSGADPGRIAFRVDGTKSAKVDQAGALHLALQRGEVIWRAPQAYQIEDGLRKTVPARFAVAGGKVRFRVGNYDRSRELIIDPVLAYSTYVAGNQFPFVEAAIDHEGNAYLTGFTGPGWPTTSGAFQTSYGGGQNDVFVTKLNRDGSALVYSTYIGGNDQDTPDAITVDNTGSAYIVGETLSSNFPVTPGAFQSSHGSSFRSFLLKLNPAGSALEYSALLPSVTVRSVAVDPMGNAFFTGGVFDNSDAVPVTPGAFRTSHGDFSVCNNTPGDGASYAWEMNSSGSAPVYVTYLSDCEQGYGIALDPEGNAYVTGLTGTRHFVTPGAFQTTAGGYIDAFVTKLNTSGSAVVYSSYYGGTIDDEGYGIAVDPAGEAMITGRTNSTNLPVVNAYQSTNFSDPNIGGFQAFVAKFNAAGTGLVYGTYLGGANADFGQAIGVDAQGRAYITGQATSYNFPTQNAFQGICGAAQGQTKSCTNTPFVTAFNADGTLLYSSWLGSKSTFGNATGIATHPSGNTLIVGATGPGFPTTPGAFQQQFQGDPTQVSDIFAVLISPTPAPGCTLNRNTPSITECEPLSGQTVTSPMHVSSLANNPGQVAAVQVYVDGSLWMSDEGPFVMDAFMNVPTGPHAIAVKGWDVDGQSYLSLADVNVSGTGSQPVCNVPTNLPSVRICEPVSGSTVPASGTHVHALANTNQQPITAMRLYVDNQSVFTVTTNSLDTTVPLSPGFHLVTVQSWDWTGQVFNENVFVTAK